MVSDIDGILLKCYSPTCSWKSRCYSPRCPFETQATLGLRRLEARNVSCWNDVNADPDPRDHLDNLQPNSYSLMDLKAVIKSNAGTSMFSMLTKMQRKWIYARELLLHNLRGLNELTCWMGMWYRVIDDAYFFSALSGHGGGLHLVSEAEQPRNEDVTIRNVGGWYNHDEYKINVVIRGRTTRGYIGVLLHEMVHAFLHIFHCQASAQCQYIVNHRTQGVGVTRHGGAWVECMRCIQDAINLVLSMSVDCDIEESIVVENEATDVE